MFQTNSAWSNGLTIELNTKDEKLWFQQHTFQQCNEVEVLKSIMGAR